jgi:hypothetical protein
MRERLKSCFVNSLRGKKSWHAKDLEWRWLKEGDRNTAFFHARASARRKTNRIKALVREDGSRCDDQKGMKRMVEGFFGSLFSVEPCVSMDEVLDAIPVKVDLHMNADLCKPYTDEEIRTALFQMGPTKAPDQMVFRLCSTRHIGN